MVDVYSVLFPKCHSSCYCCPHEQGKDDSPHNNTTFILGRLVILFDDPFAKSLITRQTLLINHYLSLTNGVLKTIDLPYVTTILEYLSQNVAEESLYMTPLHLILDLIQSRPVLKISSESIEYNDALSDYFTALGNCLIYLKDDSDLRSKIISAILNLLNDEKYVDGQVKVYHCGEALTKSKFLHRLTRSLYLINGETYVTFLDVIFTILEVVPDCGPLLVSLNFMEGLLLNLSLLNKGKQNRRHPFIITSGILLQLLNCVPKEFFKDIPPPSKQALINMKLWIEYEAVHYHSTYSNNVLAVLCRMLYVYDYLEVASSGIMKDILFLTFGVNEKIKPSWAKDVTFIDTVNGFGEYEFVTLLVTISGQLLKYKPAKNLGKEIKIACALCQYLATNKKCWNWNQAWNLSLLALQITPAVADCLPEDFINENILDRVINLIEYSANFKKYFSVSLKGVICLYSLVLNKKLSKGFENPSYISTTLSLIEMYADLPAWTLKVQITLQYLMYILHELISINSNKNSYCCIRTAKLFVRLLNRIIKPKENDSKMDPCLNLCLADLIWKLQVPEEKYREQFIKEGGVYLCIDAMEVTVFQGQIMFLGLINDLLEDNNSVAQVVTWRSKRTNKMFIELLCQLWRDCEARKQLQRSSYGTIQDVESPLEGKKQKSLKECRLDSCPPILEMIGCPRPKIFCILSLLLRRHSDTVSLIEETFDVPFRQISLYDKITLQLIKYYECLKEGEIWMNMLGTFHAIGFFPLPGEEQVLHILTMKHVQWANHIKQQQLKLENQIYQRECDEEKQLYTKIKSAKLAGALEALRTLEKDLMIEDKALRAEMKKQQMEKINKGTELEWRDQFYWETYPRDVTVTTLTAGRRTITPGFKMQTQCIPDEKNVSEYKPKKVVQVTKLLD